MASYFNSIPQPPMTTISLKDGGYRQHCKMRVTQSTYHVWTQIIEWMKGKPLSCARPHQSIIYGHTKVTVVLYGIAKTYQIEGLPSACLELMKSCYNKGHDPDEDEISQVYGYAGKEQEVREVVLQGVLTGIRQEGYNDGLLQRIYACYPQFSHEMEVLKQNSIDPRTGRWDRFF